MLMIIPALSGGLTLLLFVLPHTESAFNWDHLGGPPPESNEPIAYETVPTKEPTPRWAKRIREFLKRNRPRHVVEMLYPENATALAEQHKEIKANMTKDPTWVWRRLEELQKLKGTTIDQIPDDFKNFTFPDMNIGTYDCSKTDEKFNEYLDKVTLEEDYEKLNKKYDPYDIVHNKSIDWGEPTYDDEEFDRFLQTRIGRLLLSLYSVLSVGDYENKVNTILENIDQITSNIMQKVATGRGYINNHDIYKQYFLNNVIVETDRLEKMNLISVKFAQLIEFVVEQFEKLNLTEIENLLGNLLHNYEHVFDMLTTLFNTHVPNEQNIRESVECLFQNVINPLVSSAKRINRKCEINLGDFENIIKPTVQTYDYSIDNIEINNGNLIKTEKKSVTFAKSQADLLEEVKLNPSHINQINNVVNIFINKPYSHHKKRRSIIMETTTYLPPWDCKKQMFPDLKVPGMSSEETFEPIHSFYAKKHAAWEEHMRRKLGVMNNNSQSSFIFESFEYENPNKTRYSLLSQKKNVEKQRADHQRLRDLTRNNQSYQDEFKARKREAQQKAAKLNLEKQNVNKDKQRDKNKVSERRNNKLDDTITTSPGISIQDITNVESWFREAQIFYTREFLKEQEKVKGVATTTDNKPQSKFTIDESYERYKRRKEMRKQKKLSRRRYDSSYESRSKKSCEHCKRHRRRKNRNYKSSESDYSESSRRERRRRKNQRYSSDSSYSDRKSRYRSSYSSEGSSSEVYKNKRKHKRSNEEKTSTSTTSTTARTTSRGSTKRRTTKKANDDMDAEYEPSYVISDVPSQELTSWHYWKDWSLFYFMHPNISDANFTTNNIWKTTWPWTTKKVRVTKWRHPNVSWPPMSIDDSRSSQDSYDWGSGQSWIQNQNREMKSVEHFVRDNFFSEINEAGSRLDKMNLTFSENSQDQDMDLSENEDRMVDFSARYKKDFRLYKAKLREQEMEHKRWSLSGGNYSTTTEFDWEIKITKNYTIRSFRKGGKDIVFDISGLPMDPMSLEQIEKNLDADYLWKYGKNRTKTTTVPTTITTTISTTAKPTTSTKQSSTTAPSSTAPSIVQENQDENYLEDGKSFVNSEFDRMSSKERDEKVANFEKNFENYEQVDHNMIMNEPLAGVIRDKRDLRDVEAPKTKSLITQILQNRMKIEDFYANNKKPKMFQIYEIPELSPQEIRLKEMILQSRLNNFLQENTKQNQKHVQQNFNSIRNKRKSLRRRRRGAAPPEEQTKKPIDKDEHLNLENFNQRARPDHVVFYLTEEDLENENYKKYNHSFINDKLHEYIDDMFEELKLNHDTSEEEKIANSVYYRKYLEKRTTPFFNKLEQVIGGDNKRAIQEFTYPPDYNFDSISVRDPNKEPYLMELKKEYERNHAKSIEEMNRDIELAKQGKLNTAAWRKEEEHYVKNLPDDND